MIDGWISDIIQDIVETLSTGTRKEVLKMRKLGPRVGIMVRLPEQQRQAFKLYAVKNNTTMQDLTLELITNYLKQVEKEEEEKVSEHE